MEGFARVINHSDEAGTVRIVAVDDAGTEYGPIELSLETKATAHIDSSDIEEGNPRKGLSGGLGPGEGDWRLRLESGLDIEVLSYIRTGDGFVAAMHEVVPPQDRRHHIRFFNPGSNASQGSRLRLINPDEDEVEVTIEGRDAEGEPSPEGAVRLTLAPGEARALTAQALESGGDGLDGRLGDGAGKWQLFVSADAPIDVMNLLKSRTGHLANLSAPGLRALGEGRRQVELPLFMPASGSARKGFARLLNHSEAAGAVRIYGIDDAGTWSGPVALSLEAGAAAQFNAVDLEAGSPEKGLSGALGAGVGSWRLRLYSELDVEALAYVRTADGFVAPMHERVRESALRYHVAFFNPASNASQVSRLRLINPGEDEVEVTIAARDDAGEPAPGGEVRLALAPGEAREVGARALESGGEGLVGRLGDGAGKWQLFVSADAPIDVMNLLKSRTGHLANLSGSSQAGVVSEGGIDEAVALRIVMEVPPDVTSVRASDLTATIPGSESDDAVPPGGAPALLMASDAGGAVLYALANEDGGLLGEERGTVRVSVASTAVVLVALAAGHRIPSVTHEAVDTILSHAEFGALTRVLARLMVADKNYLTRLSDYPDVVAMIQRMSRDDVECAGSMVSIPDAALRRSIESALDKAPGALIAREEMLRITSLDASESGVKSLRGLECATELETLDLRDNQITDLSPLAGLTNLTDLTLGWNQISNLSPLAGLTNLTYLVLDRNQIADLSPLAGLTKLYWLDLHDNQIAGLSPLAGLTNLTTLKLHDNQITDLSPLAGLTKLEWLDLYVNQITDLSPLAGLTNLTTLQLDDNQSNLSPLAGLTNLTTLGLCNNQITDLSPLAGLTKLEWLRLQDNQITDLSPLAGLTNLTNLTLGWNQISNLSPLAGLTKLEWLNLENNQIAGLSPLAGLTKLTTLKLPVNQISNLSPLAGLTKLEWLNLENNQIAGLSPLAGLTNLTTLKLPVNQISNLSPLAGLTKLEWLNLENNQIAGLSPLAGLTNLTTLGLDDNQIADLSPLAGLTNLTALGLRGNQITNVSPLAGLTDLMWLSLTDNQIADVSPLAGLTSLTELRLHRNPICDRMPELEINGLSPCGTGSLAGRDAATLASAKRSAAAGRGSVPPDGVVKENFYCTPLTRWPCSPWDAHEPWRWFGNAKGAEAYYPDGTSRSDFILAFNPAVEAYFDFLEEATHPPFLARSDAEHSREVHAAANPSFVRYAMELYEGSDFRDWYYVPGNATTLDKLLNSGAAYRKVRAGTGLELVPDIDRIRFERYRLTGERTQAFGGEGGLPDHAAMVSFLNAFRLLSSIANVVTDVSAVDAWLDSLARDPRSDLEFASCAVAVGERYVVSNDPNRSRLEWMATVVQDFAPALVRTVLTDDACRALIIRAGGQHLERALRRLIAQATLDTIATVLTGAKAIFDTANDIVPSAVSYFAPSAARSEYYIEWDETPDGQAYIARVSLRPLPVAAFTYAQQRGFEVTLDASASEGEELAYEWQAAGRRIGTRRVLAHDFRAAESFDVTLTVTDRSGVTAEERGSVSVTAGRIPEVSGLTCTPTGNGTAFTMQAAFSDADDDIETVQWFSGLSGGLPDQETGAGVGHVTLSAPAGASHTRAKVRVVDARGNEAERNCEVVFDAGPPVPRIAAASAEEGELLEFTVTLDREPSRGVTYYYATYRASARDADYDGHYATSLRFGPGERSKTITVRTTEDTRVEADETFYVYLAESTGDLPFEGLPVSYLARATGTIRDDDEAATPVPSIANASADEGEAVVFTVTLDRAPASAVTFYYATYRGTATANDYTGHLATALRFASGERTKTITVRTTEDARVEADETFRVYVTDATGKLTVSAPTDYLARATGTIRDDDEAATPVPSIANASADEGEAVVFTVTLDRAPASAVTFYYATYRGTATANDYTGHLATALRFASGERTKTITVRTTEDARVEADETFRVYVTDATGKLTVSAPTDYLARATGTIRDDDETATPVPSIANASADEGEAVVFTVTLDRAPASAVTFYYATYRGTATANDYTGHLATALRFASGERTKTITVRTTEDARVEADETFRVYVTDATGKLTVSAPTDYLARATGTIRDDDETATPVPSIANASADEGEAVVFTVTLDRAPASAVTFYYATYRVTASANDYTGHLATALRFASGERSKTITVRTTEDARVEADETFYVYLTDASSKHPLSGVPTDYLARATGTIRDDDETATPVPSIANASANEGEAVVFTVRLDRAPASAVTFYYATYRVTASANDYTGHLATALRFASGERSKTITVRTTEDTRVEADETFYVYLTDASSKHPLSGVPTDSLARATGTIRDDDEAATPVPSIANASANEGEAVVFTVRLDRAPASAVTFYYATYRVTASANDYTGHLATALRFASGERSKTITVRTTEDTRVEADETFYVYLTDASSKHPLSGVPTDSLARATGTIRDDDEVTGSCTGATVSIPDAALRRVIEQVLGKGPNSPITPEEMLGLTGLGFDNRGVRSLQGLECATNLDRLSLARNQITNLSPLVGLTKLRRLWLGVNKITNISPLTKHTKLEFLDLTDNQITNISPLAGLKKLEKLALTDNQITNISPLAGLKKLEQLSLRDNRVSSLRPLAGLTNLSAELVLDGNQITNLSPLAGLTKLEILHLSNNQITDLSPLAGLTKLGGLYLHNNKITNLSPLTGLTNLVRLWLQSNSISDIDPLVANGGLGERDQVELYYNPLSDDSQNVHIPALRARGVYVGWN